MRLDIKQRTFFFDGAMGTELQKLGITSAPVLANLSNPKEVQDVHKQYSEAGADILTANTFGAYYHNHSNYAQLISAAFNNARLVHKGLVALDLGPTGLILEPYGTDTTDYVADIFTKTIDAGLKNNADLILIETMMDINELEIAAGLAKKTKLPIFGSMSFNENGRTMYGNSIKDIVECLDNLNVDAIGINCGNGFNNLNAFAVELLTLTRTPIFMQPNAGLPEMINGAITYTLTPQDYASFMLELKEHGVSILGGCCGTTPEHIKQMVRMCQK